MEPAISQASDTDQQQAEQKEPASPSQSNSSHPPTKPIPTTRAKIASQLSYLRAFAAASNSARKAVQVPEVAQVAGVHASTISACNSFFIECGFIEKVGRAYKPADTLYDFHRAWSWEPETAAHKLAPIVRHTWFWEVLSGRLSFNPLSEDDAISVLADASSAGPEYRPQLEMLIELLEAVGLVTRRDGVVSEAKKHHGSGGETVAVTPDFKQEQPSVAPATKDTQEVPSNSMSLSMSISVPMDELSKWNDPEKVTTFFSTWAKLVNAKAEIEAMLKGEFSESATRSEGGDVGAA